MNCCSYNAVSVDFFPEFFHFFIVHVKCSVVLCNFPFSLILSSAVGEHSHGKDKGTEQIRKVSKVFINPWYNHSSTDSDIALLRLLSPITLDPFAIPVSLPPANGTFGCTIGAIRMSTFSEWGRLAQPGLPSLVLQRLEVPRVSLDECRTKLGL